MPRPTPPKAPTPALSPSQRAKGRGGALSKKTQSFSGNMRQEKSKAFAQRRDVAAEAAGGPRALSSDFGKISHAYHTKLRLQESSVHRSKAEPGFARRAAQAARAAADRIRDENSDDEALASPSKGMMDGSARRRAASAGDSTRRKKVLTADEILAARREAGHSASGVKALTPDKENVNGAARDDGGTGGGKGGVVPALGGAEMETADAHREARAGRPVTAGRAADSLSKAPLEPKSLSKSFAPAAASDDSAFDFSRAEERHLYAGSGAPGDEGSDVDDEPLPSLDDELETPGPTPDGRSGAAQFRPATAGEVSRTNDWWQGFEDKSAAEDGGGSGGGGSGALSGGGGISESEASFQGFFGGSPIDAADAMQSVRPLSAASTASIGSAMTGRSQESVSSHVSSLWLGEAERRGAMEARARAEFFSMYRKKDGRFKKGEKHPVGKRGEAISLVGADGHASLSLSEAKDSPRRAYLEHCAEAGISAMPMDRVGSRKERVGWRPPTAGPRPSLDLKGMGLGAETRPTSGFSRSGTGFSRPHASVLGKEAMRGTAVADTLPTMSDLDSVDLSVDRSGNEMSDVLCARMLERLLAQAHCLEVLNLSGNRIGTFASEQLSELLFADGAVLRELSLNSCRITDNCKDADGEIALSFITASTTVRKLSLRDNLIGDAGIRSMADTLSLNKALTELDLSWNNIGAKGAAEIGECIADNQVLKALHLGWNHVGDETITESSGRQVCGAVKLSAKLQSNRSLTLLDLSYNRIYDQGCMMLGSMMKSNRTIVKLVMDGNAVGLAGGRALMNSLRDLGDARDISLRECNMADRSGKGLGGGHRSNAAGSALFDAHSPAGKYRLNLADAYDLGIATEICELMEVDQTKAKEGGAAEDKRCDVAPKCDESGGLCHSCCGALPRLAASNSWKKGSVRFFEWSNPNARGGRGGSPGKSVRATDSVDVVGTAGPPSSAACLEMLRERLAVIAADDIHAYGVIAFELEHIDRLPTAEDVVTDVAMGKLMSMVSDTSSKTKAKSHWKKAGLAARLGVGGALATAKKAADRAAQLAALQDAEQARVDAMDMATRSAYDDQVAERGLPKGSIIPVALPDTPPKMALPKKPEPERKRETDAERKGKETKRQQQLNIIELASREWHFSCAQLATLLAGIDEPAIKNMAAVKLFERVIDPENFMLAVGPSMSEGERIICRSKLGVLLQLDPVNPTGHYRLELSRRMDRVVAQKLLAQSNDENSLREGIGLIDTSQNLNRHSFRNTVHGSKPIKLLKEIPSSGALEFDYTSTFLGGQPRTRARCERVSDGQMAALLTKDGPIAQLARRPVVRIYDQWSLEHVRIVNGVRALARGDAGGHGLFFSSHQLVQILLAFGVMPCYIYCQPSWDGADELAQASAEQPIPELGIKASNLGYAEGNTDVLVAQVCLPCGHAVLGETEAEKVKPKSTHCPYCDHVVESLCALGDEKVPKHEHHADIPDGNVVHERMLMLKDAGFLLDPGVREDGSTDKFEEREFGERANDGGNRRLGLEIAITLFSRVVDVKDFWKVAQHFSNEECAVLYHRLGPLNSLNPLYADGEWELDLGVPDERVVVGYLVKLTEEPGENWLREQFDDGRGRYTEVGRWDLPAPWVSDVGPPHNGRLKTIFFCASKHVDLELRESLLSPPWHGVLMAEELQNEKEHGSGESGEMLTPAKGAAAAATATAAAPSAAVAAAAADPVLAPPSPGHHREIFHGVNC